jgi:hypothetical protein
MRRIEDPDLKLLAVDSFDRTFQIDATRPPGIWKHDTRADLAAGFLYPESYVLTDESFSAVRKPLERLDGASTYFMRMLENRPRDDEWWLISWDQANEYEMTQPTLDLLENVAYSQRARWGMFFSEDQFAVVFAPKETVKEIEAGMGRTSRENLEQFVNDQKYLFPADGPPFLDALYDRFDVGV